MVLALNRSVCIRPSLTFSAWTEKHMKTRDNEQGNYLCCEVVALPGGKSITILALRWRLYQSIEQQQAKGVYVTLSLHANCSLPTVPLHSEHCFQFQKTENSSLQKTGRRGKKICRVTLTNYTICIQNTRKWKSSVEQFMAVQRRESVHDGTGALRKSHTVPHPTYTSSLPHQQCPQVLPGLPCPLLWACPSLFPCGKHHGSILKGRHQAHTISNCHKHKSK